MTKVTRHLHQHLLHPQLSSSTLAAAASTERSQAEVLTTLGLFDGMFFFITLSVCMLCMLLAFIGFTKSESQKCNKSGNINDGYI